MVCGKDMGLSPTDGPVREYKGKQATQVSRTVSSNGDQASLKPARGVANGKIFQQAVPGKRKKQPDGIKPGKSRKVAKSGKKASMPAEAVEAAETEEPEVMIYDELQHGGPESAKPKKPKKKKSNNSKSSS